MPSVISPRSSLWTPEGEVALAQKDVIVVTNPVWRMAIAGFHEFAQHYGISVVCKRCDTSITGRNAGTEKVAVVACQCREWKLVR